MGQSFYLQPRQLSSTPPPPSQHSYTLEMIVFLVKY